MYAGDKMRQSIMTRMIVNQVNRAAEGKDKPRLDSNTQRQLVSKLAKINDKIKDIGFKLDALDNHEIKGKEKDKLERAMAKNLKEKAVIIKQLGFAGK